MKNKTVMRVIAVVLVVCAVLSATVVYKAFSADSYLQPQITYLNDKKNTVLEMAAVATAASAAITLIPGDAGTPIAEKLVDLSNYTIIILCAVFLEKYLVEITAMAAFRVIIPIGLIVAAVFLFMLKKRQAGIGLRLALCGALIFAVIPVSLSISRSIDKTYSTTIEQTLEDAREDTQEIQNNAENQTALEKFINKIKGGAKTVIDKFQKTLTNLVEAFAVMIVTSCLIPILVYLVLWWLIKNMLAFSGISVMPRKYNGELVELVPAQAAGGQAQAALAAGECAGLQQEP